MPIDWVGLAGVIMGTLIVLIPVAGITLRFALKPITEAVIAFKASEGKDEQMRLLEKRIAYLEHQNDNIESELERIAEVAEFHRRLGSSEAAAGGASEE